MHPDPLERLLRAADIPIEPRPEFSEALLKTLLEQIDDFQQSHEEVETNMNRTIALTPASGMSHSRPELSQTQREATARKSSILLGYLATAALLMLTMVGGLYAAGIHRNWGLLHQSSPGVQNELIARADVESTPDNFETSFTAISRFTLDPGESMDSGPDTSYGDGVYLFEVEAGALTIESDGPTEVLSGESDQGTPSLNGASETLQVGDRGVLSLGATTTWRNDGPNPTVVLIAQAAEAVDSPLDLDQIDMVKSFTIIWPELPAEFAFRRLTFEPGASLPVADLPGLIMLGVETGEIDLPLVDADGSTRDRGFEPLDGFVSKDWELAPDGELHNLGSEPVVVYVLLGETTEPAATPEA